MSPAYALDLELLERSYKELQSLIHPDRHAQAAQAEQRASMQWTTRVNDAYRTLRDPVQRAKHLLELRGVDLGFETDTRMPADFLMQQLELREKLEEAKDAKALDALRKDLFSLRDSLQGEIARAIDTEKDYAGAADLVRKLQFLRRLDEEIDEAYEALE